MTSCSRRSPKADADDAAAEEEEEEAEKRMTSRRPVDCLPMPTAKRFDNEARRRECSRASDVDLSPNGFLRRLLILYKIMITVGHSLQKHLLQNITRGITHKIINGGNYFPIRVTIHSVQT